LIKSLDFNIISTEATGGMTQHSNQKASKRVRSMLAKVEAMSDDVGSTLVQKRPVRVKHDA